MSRPDDHVVFEELAAGHALSALEPEEQQRFLEHLAGCARCERDVAEHEATLALLALSCEPVQPPPSVLEGVRAGLPLGRASPVRAGSSPESGSPDASAPAASSLVAARERRSRRAGRAVQWVGAAAAAALVLSLGAWNLALRADRDEQQQYGDRLAIAVRGLASPGSRNVPLSEPDGDVVAVAVMQDGQMSLVVDGLAPNDSDSTYVLWAQDGSGGVRAVGAFDVDDPQIDVLTDMRVEGGTTGVTALMLSEEQGDVAPAKPGAPPLAAGQA